MHQRSLFAALLTTVMVVVGLSWWRAEQPEPVPVEPERVSPRLEWQAGAMQSYRLAIESDVRLYLQEEPTRLVQHLSGDLHLRVFEREGDRIRVGFQLQPAHYLLGGERDAGLDARLSSPFFALFEPGGRPLAFEFARRLPEAEQLLLEEAVRTFQLVLPAEPSRAWMSAEEHATGRYLARYEAQADGRLSKQKTLYTEVDPQLQLFESGASPELRVEASRASFRVASDTWLEEASVEERSSVVNGRQTSIETSLQASLERIPVARAREVALFADDPWQELLRAALPGDAGVPAGPTDEVTAPASMPASRTAYLASMLARWQESEAGTVAKLKELVEALQRNPALADEVATMIRESRSPDDAASVMIHALERAGTAEAQGALVLLMNDPDVVESNRLRAIVAMGGLENANDEVIQTLFERSYERGDRRQADLANTAQLSLGSIAGTLATTDQERADRLNDAIEQSLWQAVDPGEVAMVFKAMSNSGDARFVGTIVPYLDDDSDYVRASAARALGQVDRSGETLDKLTRQLAREESTRVRLALAEALSGVGNASPASLKTVAERIRLEPQVTTRYTMARYLGENLSLYPEGVSTLKRLALTDSSERVRRYAASVLYAQSEP